MFHGKILVVHSSLFQKGNRTDGNGSIWCNDEEVAEQIEEVTLSVETGTIGEGAHQLEQPSPLRGSYHFLLLL